MDGSTVACVETGAKECFLALKEMNPRLINGMKTMGL